MRRAGLAHAANLVHADSLNYCFFALLSEALLVLEEAELQNKEDAIRGLCKALSLALALMIASYEDSAIRALGGNPDLLRTVLKVYAKELLKGG